MEKHFAEHLDLEQLCGLVHLSKSTLLRAFTRAKGITPYHYLVNLRICAAKRLLEQGASLLEAAMQTGFSDQSHFTNCFSRYIGLTPGAYQEIFTRGGRLSFKQAVWIFGVAALLTQPWKLMTSPREGRG